MAPPEAAATEGSPAKAARPEVSPTKGPVEGIPVKGSRAKAPGVFEALGEQVRRRILEVLADGELPVGPLVVALRSLTPISQPAVSQHLKVLLDAGLVTVRAAGTRRLYALDTAGLDAARAWLDRLADPLAPFTQPLDALATEVARGRRASRANTAGRANTANKSDRAEEPPDARDRRPA